MTKKEIISRVSEQQGITKAEAEKTINSFLDNVQGSLATGDKVSLAGFGNFEVRSRAARMGRNPKTGEEMQIKASKSVGFKPAKAFKDSLNA